MAAKDIRLGLIGVGRWGRNYVRTIQELSDVKLVAVSTRSPQATAIVPIGCRVVPNWRDVVAAQDIDGVIIATPPSLHAEMLIAAIDSNKPVLIEKPLVQSRSDAKRISSHLEGRTATILVDHTHLFHPAFCALKKEAETLGPIRSIKAAAGNLGPYRRDLSVLWDWAPHDLAMCLTLVPGAARPIRKDRLDMQSVEGATAETIAIEIELTGAIPASLRFSTLEEKHRWFAVTFESCALVYRDLDHNSLVRLRSGEDLQSPGEPIAVRSDAPLTMAVLNFIEAIKMRETSRKSIDLGLAVVDLVAEIEAFEPGRTAIFS